MASIWIDMTHSTINVKLDNNSQGGQCILLEEKTATDTITKHFHSKSDLEAYAAMINIAAGREKP